MTELDLTGVTPELLARYDRPGPRYTSYPTAPLFTEEVDQNVYRKRLAQAAERTDEPLSMYVHVPFCEHRCRYCGCNVVISPRRGPEDAYLDAVERELDLLAAGLGQRRQLSQLHWGGGTPTYLSPDQCERLQHAIVSRFPLTNDAEVAIEVDPCVTSPEHLHTLRQLGFNRLSVGVQDLDPVVQKAVERIQPLELSREQIVLARQLGFGSVNVDLIYGLPHQNEQQFRDSVRTVISELAPDRLACFSFAHIPWIKPHQRALDPTTIATGWEKYRIFAGAAEELLAAGYRFIGFDHFATPSDELTHALDAGTIHRNFMGYTVMPATDQVGVGVTAIGDVAGVYVANERNLARYQRAVTDGQLAVDRGVVRSREDELRGTVIRRLICTLRLELTEIERSFEIDFKRHFAEALTELGPMADDGLVELDANEIRVTPLGRLFLRNLCMPFDAYLKRPSERPIFSRTV